VYTNDLEKIFAENTGNIIHKWKHYFEIYDKHFQRYRNKKVTILEIGIFKGGSLDMWQKYFGDNCQIIGIDINPLCKRFENDKIKVYIGSQEDRSFLRKIKAEIPKVDILIDDGGHMMDQLRISFEELYDLVDENGVYLAEDLHTCYLPEYDGGYKRKRSFMEYCKELIDQLNAWHSNQRKLKITEFTKTTHSIHFYESIVVFEKRKIEQPYHLFSGKEESEDIISDPPKVSSWKKLKILLYKHLGIDLG
jgi:SAM-dependent methyltransferase